ncbi:MAG: 7-carboxy-7-deazaguanine synthase QueE [Bacteroidota bacterium]
MKDLLNKKYPVMEDFYTIQGEGMNTGRSAYFIRLGGCDVECVWCDVKESWDANKHPLLTVSDLLQKVKESQTKLVVITGGEPAMHDLTALTSVLKEHGYELAIETSGAHALTGTWDWICLSPKKFKAPLPENMQYAHELKVVIYHPSDFEWAEKYKAMVNDNCTCLLQPEYSKHTKAVELIVDYVKSNPTWRISLQTHKIINVP